MGDVATLLYGVAALVGAIGSAAAVVINAVRSSRRERPVAARQALGRLAKAAADGQISNKELASILDKLRSEVEPDKADNADNDDNSDNSSGGNAKTPGARGHIAGVLPHPSTPHAPPRRRRGHKSG